MSPSPDARPHLEGRRSALTRIGATAIALGYAGAIAYPIYRYLATPVTRAEKAGRISEVAVPLADAPKKGQAMLFKFGYQPAILVRSKEGVWTCFSAVCTHLACTVSFDDAAQQIICACHGGSYDAASGEVLGGPPPEPLPRFEVEESGEELIIRRA